MIWAPRARSSLESRVVTGRHDAVAASPGKTPATLAAADLKSGECQTHRGVVDQYESADHLCWYLDRPSDEIVQAVSTGWLGPPGCVLDVGCGLGVELQYLHEHGWEGLGIDLSRVALSRAAHTVQGVHFVVADACRIPVNDGWADAVIDRGCFHYLEASDRWRYEREAWRVLRPGGHLLLRACLPHVPGTDPLSVDYLRDLFRQWIQRSIEPHDIPVQSGTLHAIVGRLDRP